MSKKIKGKKVSKNIPKNKTMYPDIPKEWLYMLPEDRTLREMYEEHVKNGKQNIGKKQKP